MCVLVVCTDSGLKGLFPYCMRTVVTSNQACHISVDRKLNDLYMYQKVECKFDVCILVDIPLYAAIGHGL